MLAVNNDYFCMPQFSWDINICKSHICKKNDCVDITKKVAKLSRMNFIRKRKESTLLRIKI